MWKCWSPGENTLLTSHPYRRGQYDFTSRPPRNTIARSTRAHCSVWLLTFDLPGEVDPKGMDVPASTALGVVAALKPDHHVKVAAIGQDSIVNKHLKNKDISGIAYFKDEI